MAKAKVIKAPELIEEAISILEAPNSWCKGTLVKPNGQVCAIGALYKAAGADVVEMNAGRERWAEFKPVSEEQRQEINKAKVALNKAVRDAPTDNLRGKFMTSIIGFNDTKGRRRAAIVKMFRAAKDRL